MPAADVLNAEADTNPVTVVERKTVSHAITTNQCRGNHSTSSEQLGQDLLLK
jgi:hypothetical protein